MIDVYGNVVVCPMCQSKDIAQKLSGVITDTTKFRCNICGYKFSNSKIENWNQKINMGRFRNGKI